MTRSFLLSFAIAAATASLSGAVPADPAGIIARIDTSALAAGAEFAVTMPQLPDDVVYSLRISQTPTPADTLCPAAYLVDWKVTARPGMDEPGAADSGFNAYFAGNYFSLMAERLRERHAEAEPDAFRRPRRGGVAVTGQFADLVPALMAERLREMAADPRYTVTAVADTIVGGEKAVAVLTHLTVGGSTASEGEYLFYPGERLSPRRVTLENNTGSIGEQTVTVSYTRPEAGAAPTTEDALMALYPDEFSRFRTSAYRLENLPGRHLPAIAAPTLGGDRFTRTASQPLDAPTVVVILDAASEFTPEVIEAVRAARRSLPWRTDVVWAFTDTNPDNILAVLPSTEADETALRSARAVARDCGAASVIPAVIFAGTDGVVADFIAGFNKSFASDVVRKMTGLQP